MQEDFPKIDDSLPAADELEVSLFGPGVGECVVVHLGDNKWMIVDSCKDPSTKEPIALSYLKSLGLDPSEVVSLIVISHWHSDHIGGAAKLVEACTHAKVVYSQALLKQEFLTLVDAFTISAAAVGSETSGVSELAAIVKMLDSRETAKPGYVRAFLKPAISDRRIHNADIGGCNSQVWTLSPSDASVHNALIEISSLIPNDGDQRKVIPRPTSNKNAVAVWVELGECSALLGADLEETKDEETGWSAIVNSGARPVGEAAIFKVPHHGSATGHSHEVWDQMLGENPAAICTTYNNSHLPREEDITRIKRYTNELYCTTLPRVRPVKRDRTVERTMSEAVKSRHVLGGVVGQLQIRLRQNGEQSVASKPPAVRL